MAYGSIDKASDSFGMVGAVTGSGGQGFFEDKESMVKGGLRAGMGLSTGVATILKGMGQASNLSGPIGAGVGFTLDTCINFYEASKDIGKANSKIAALKVLEGQAAGETKKIITWLINKMGRRANYDHAETGGAYIMAASVKQSWDQGKKKSAVAKGVGTGIATVLGTVGGQLGTKGVRAGRGALKKAGFMGSKRKDYAKKLYSLAKNDPVAKKVLLLVLNAGVADQDAAKQMQDKIDNVVVGALEKSMSSFKE